MVQVERHGKARRQAVSAKFLGSSVFIQFLQNRPALPESHPPSASTCCSTARSGPMVPHGEFSATDQQFLLCGTILLPATLLPLDHANAEGIVTSFPLSGHSMLKPGRQQSAAAIASRASESVARNCSTHSLFYLLGRCLLLFCGASLSGFPAWAINQPVMPSPLTRSACQVCQFVKLQ